MTNALMKAAGSLSLYRLVTRQPPTMVAALLAKVNCKEGGREGACEQNTVVFDDGGQSAVTVATLKNQSTGSVIPKNWTCIPCGELYREITSNPSRKNPNALAKASWCFCGGKG